MEDQSALPHSLFCELSPDEVHVTAGVVECGGLLDGLALDWDVLQLQQGDDAVGSLDLTNGGRTWGILGQHVPHAGVAGQHPLDRVAVAVPRPVEKVVVPLTTRRPVNQLLAGIKRPALPALSLAGPDLMTPIQSRQRIQPLACWMMVALSLTDLLVKASQQDR